MIAPVHVALGGAVRELADRLQQLADSIERGERAEHMAPVRLLVLAADSLAAARTLEKELVILEGIVRVVHRLPVAAGRESAN